MRDVVQAPVLSKGSLSKHFHSGKAGRGDKIALARSWEAQEEEEEWSLTLRSSHPTVTELSPRHVP